MHSKRVIAVFLAVSSIILCSACDDEKKTEPMVIPCLEGNVCADASRVCINNLYCVPRCTPNSCDEGYECAASGICTKAAAPGPQGPECSQDVPCTDSSQLCNDGKCVDKCFLKGCPDGMACNSDGLCVVGECTSWQRCYENGFDRTYVCDVPNFKCIKQCATGTCGSGKYCDSDDYLCHDGECSEIDACTGSKVCDLQSHKCIEKCTSNTSCNGLLCDVDGRCVEPCATGMCRNGKVCDPDSKLCIEADCSALDGCMQSYQICDKGHCVDRCTMSGAKCNEDAVCNAQSGLCVPRCTADSCHANGQICGNQGRCVDGECSIVEPCADNTKVCSSDYKCVTPKVIKNDCYFYSTCESLCDGTRENDCNECLAKSKWCEAGKQCNAYNECINSADADGLGLGVACNDNDANKKCASDLYCDTKQKVCLQAAFKVQGTSCTAGSYADHCEGNLIVECSEYYSQVMVYDCKTYYTDWDLATNAKFYGDDFVCAKQPGSQYAACAQLCTAENVITGATQHICSRDLDDTEIEYSSTYLCKYNEEGIPAYFYDSSDECWYGCDEDKGGTCDN